MGEREKSFYSNACTRAIITSREENQSVCFCVLCHTSSVSLCVCARSNVQYPPLTNTQPGLLLTLTHTKTRVCVRVCVRVQQSERVVVGGGVCLMDETGDHGD